MSAGVHSCDEVDLPKERGTVSSLTFFHGPMDCGKSTLALQIDHNQARQGRRGPARRSR